MDILKTAGCFLGCWTLATLSFAQTTDSVQPSVMTGSGATASISDRVEAVPGAVPVVTSTPELDATPAAPPKDWDKAIKNAYQGVFYANDYSYLLNPEFQGPYFFGDALKGRANGKLDIGGEFRSRFHDENGHRGVGVTGNDDTFWLTRLRLFANYRVTERFRFYTEYLYADSAGEQFPSRPIEENRGELNNLFFDWKMTDRLSVRTGRQEIILGARRLIAALDWGNTRRTFDGVRATYAGDLWNVDSFFLQPVNRSPLTGGTLEWDNTQTAAQLYGVYGTRENLMANMNMDAYYIGYENDLVGLNYHTIGSRFWGSGACVDYELEGGVQFGEEGNGSDHGNGFVTAGLGRDLHLLNNHWNPKLWLWYDWASGGGTFGSGDQGFDHLFPLAHKYNGLMDLFGRRNLHDVNAQFTTPTPFKKVSLLVWYHYFFLDQATTPYNVNMTAYNTVAAAGSRDLGHEIDLVATVTMNPRTNLLLGYSYFITGDYYSTTPGVASSEDAEFYYAQFQFRF